MKTIDTAFLAIAAVIQVGLAIGLLWVTYSGPLSTVLSGSVSTEAPPQLLATLVAEYRQALAIAKELFADVGFALLCSFGLTIIVMYRARRRRGEAPG